MKDPNWFPFHGGYLAQSESWEYRLYKFDPLFRGDFVNTAMSKAIEDKDPTNIPANADLLIAGKRWPDEVEEVYGGKEYTAQTRWEWEVSKWKRFTRRVKRLRGDDINWKYVWWHVRVNIKHGWEKTWNDFIKDIDWKRLDEVDQVLFRPQSGKSRDPYCKFFAACVLASPGKIYTDFIKVVKVEWWLHTSLTFWAWVRFVKTGRFGNLYHWLETRDNLIKPKAFVGELAEIRLEVFNYLKSEG